jgi:hypothetical protein
LMGVRSFPQGIGTRIIDWRKSSPLVSLRGHSLILGRGVEWQVCMPWQLPEPLL